MFSSSSCSTLYSDCWVGWCWWFTGQSCDTICAASSLFSELQNRRCNQAKGESPIFDWVFRIATKNEQIIWNEQQRISKKINKESQKKRKNLKPVAGWTSALSAEGRDSPAQGFPKHSHCTLLHWHCKLQIAHWHCTLTLHVAHCTLPVHWKIVTQTLLSYS